MSFPSTPMSPEDARRQQEQDALDNARVNSKEAKSRKLTIADLGGSKKRKYKKTRKGKKSRKTRGGNRIGGNNIGANCNEPNFSIYNTNLLKLFPYKGGSVTPPESNTELLKSPEAQERQRLQDEAIQRLEDEEHEARQRLIEEDERNRLDNIRRQNEEDDRIRENIQNDFVNGPVIPRIPNPFINNISDNDSVMERLSLSELGGSKQKNKRKSRKSRKSITKGGELQSDDIYKNNEGPQF